MRGAIAACREAIRLKPDYAEAHTNLGLALYGSGDVSGAIAEYREAIRLKPDLVQPHSNLGNALSDRATWRCVAACREAIRLKPDFAEAHCNLGLALKNSGDVRGAIAEYREAVRLKPDLAEAHSNLGNALRVGGSRTGRSPRAARRSASSPTTPQLTTTSASSCSAGEVDEAIAEYREAIRLKPDDAEAHCNLGVALLGQGKVDEAIAAHRAALRLNRNPNYPNIPNNLAWALAMSPSRPSGDYDEAALGPRPQGGRARSQGGRLVQHAGPG